MTTTRNHVVFGALQENVLNRLAEVCDVAVNGDLDAAASVARAEMPRLVAGLRALVLQHRPDENGQCVQCVAGRWWRRIAVPCHVLLELQLSMMNYDQKPIRPSRHRARGRRWS